MKKLYILHRMDKYGRVSIYGPGGEWYFAPNIPFTFATRKAGEDHLHRLSESIDRDQYYWVRGPNGGLGKAILCPSPDSW